MWIIWPCTYWGSDIFIILWFYSSKGFTEVKLFPNVSRKWLLKHEKVINHIYQICYNFCFLCSSMLIAEIHGNITWTKNKTNLSYLENLTQFTFGFILHWNGNSYNKDTFVCAKCIMPVESTYTYRIVTNPLLYPTTQLSSCIISLKYLKHHKQD